VDAKRDGAHALAAVAAEACARPGRPALHRRPFSTASRPLPARARHRRVSRRHRKAGGSPPARPVALDDGSSEVTNSRPSVTGRLFTHVWPLPATTWLGPRQVAFGPFANAAALGAIEKIGDHGVTVACELVVGTAGPVAPRPKIVTDCEPVDRAEGGDPSLHDMQ